MKHTKESQILWHEPERRYSKPCATLKPDGTLCFGEHMKSKLSNKVRIGFLSEECALFVLANADTGAELPKNGMKKVADIARAVCRLDIQLPAHFLFEEETKNMWRGHIIPNPRKPEMEIHTQNDINIVLGHKHLIEKAVYRYAKTTPMEERRATAYTALFEGFRTHTSIDGPLNEYLFEQIKTKLIEHNKQYVRHNPYHTHSIDANPGTEKLLQQHPHDEMLTVESEIDIAIFEKRHLDMRERKIFKMLRDNQSVAEILHVTRITEQELNEICQSIGMRWTAFYQMDCTG